MAKNRVKLDVCGVSCTLLTDDSEEYILSLGAEVEKLIKPMVTNASAIPMAAIIAALSYLDESKQKSAVIDKLEKKLALMESTEEQNALYDKKLIDKDKELAGLRSECQALSLKLEASDKKCSELKHNTGELRNPMRPCIDTTGLVDFYEKK